ncbi:AGE family epimerase/isomerase [Agrobacterium tumefaciens]|uniref:AGE family epimerase/isomerase n=1 Tax=Agrobacterium tumefaciens TaxID=358 RepID=UPI00287DC354|nr:AGE family epimerase/isomerase [Agrobacterium tumefaciens]MDS7595563.1 AGE family epimerase/isomerase [Agrobacterium tumefaciens]
MTVQFPSIAHELADQVRVLRRWLDEDALPLWWQVGAAKPDGGFYERVGQDAKPIFADNRRSRVQPRQAYCFAAAGQKGWNGPWQAAVNHGLTWFDRVYRLDNGLYGNLADQTGKLIDPTFDLYNQAFALFAAAQASATIPARRDEMRTRALDILSILKRDYKHPVTGFEEANPPRTPLCSNPHMHLFEAMLAWEAQDPEGPWAALADEIAMLAMHRFIDSENGGLREFFDHDWKPYPGDKGRIMEPGHQFEWAWLLVRWGSLRGNSDAIAKAKRLFQIGEEYGICARRKVAIMSLYDDFSVHDGLARLWPQTEWLKAAVRLASVTIGEERQRYLASGVRAIGALQPFLDTPVKGLWFDKWPAEKPMIDEPAPASTFYHIVCAIYEAEDVLASSAG